ncbi:sortase [Acetobacteraceae bacterium]|nr:sortase [Candidatus Parcubacteria bacterium]
MQKRKPGVIPQIVRHPISFSVSFFVIFFLMLAFLSSVDALPEKTSAHSNATEVQTPVVVKEPVAIENPEAPVRIVIKSAGVDATVANPVSTKVSVLDASLHSGAARYPTSALLGTSGTVLLFGHSSNLAVVHNKAYKTFNNIEKLKAGSVVSVYSDTTEYRYKVTGVRLADASEDVIQLPKTGRHLVLVTCDNFTSKSARFVVTADFVGTYSLGN